MAEPNDGATAPTRRAHLRRPGPTTLRRAGLLGGAAAIALVAYAAGGGLDAGPPAITQADVRRAVADVLASMPPAPPDSVVAYEAIQPSLVLVETHESFNAQGAGGVGGGVVLDLTGAVLTAYHVVEGAGSIELTFSDGTYTTARVLRAEPAADIAILQPDKLPRVMVPATLRNPRSLPIGSQAFVVGNPFGLTDTITSGIISGFDRTFRRSDSGAPLTGLIQVDAAVNPGNSGGPLLDRAGRVIGIVEALLNPTRDDVFVGVGLAIPIDIAGGVAGLPPY
ncbi:MAG: trypsin-like peptidase domain-containing protein [Chloroflexota bacterium]